jgi:hypothetical protein
MKGVIWMTVLKRWQFDLPMHPGDLLGQWAKGRRDRIEFDLFE